MYNPPRIRPKGVPKGKQKVNKSLVEILVDACETLCEEETFHPNSSVLNHPHKKKRSMIQVSTLSSVVLLSLLTSTTTPGWMVRKNLSTQSLVNHTQRRFLEERDNFMLR